MSLHRQLAQNTVIHLAGKVVSLLLGVFSIGLITRYLGIEGYGYYTTAYAFIHFFGMLSDFGLTLTTVQMIADERRDESKLLNSIISFRIITGAALMLLAVGLIWLFPYNQVIKVGAGISVCAFFSTLIIQILTVLFQKKLEIYKVSLAEIAGRLVYVGALLLVIMKGLGIYWIFAALSLEGLLYLTILLIFTRKYIDWKWEVDFSLWKEILRRTWPLTLSIAFNLIYLRMDAIILSLTRSSAEVGLYGAAYKIVDVLTMMAAVFMGLLLPVITKYYAEKNMADLKDLLQKGFDALIIFALPTVFGAWLVAEPFMRLFAGDNFAAAGGILRVLILAAGIIFATSLFSYSVVAIEQQKRLMWGFLVTAILTLVGYLIFIPMFGVYGAAWMTVFSECLVLIWSASVVKQTINFLPRLNIFLRTIPATILMSLFLFHFSFLNVYLSIPIAAVVYFLALFAVGGVRWASIRTILIKSN